MSMFIRVEVDPEEGARAEVAKKLVEVCPVDIFSLSQDGSVQTVEANMGECTLCDLCIEAAPRGSVKVIKLYETE